MTPQEITSKYYAKWLGVEPRILDKSGILMITNPLRNEQPVGDANILDVYAYITPKTIIISYGNRAAEKIPELENRLIIGMPTEEISVILSEVYQIQPSHHIKYIYINKITDGESAGKLSKDDYKLYLDFFKKVNPGCKDISWVKEYFYEMVNKGYCHGIIVDHQLVSATDAPNMPFMSSTVQEIGINTHPMYQGKGYAKSVCLSCVNEMLHNEICPQWSANASNIASQKLAVSIGFKKYFDNLTLCLSH